MNLINLSFSVHCRICLCAGHGIFKDAKASPLGRIHRLCRRWSSHLDADVVSTIPCLGSSDTTIGPPLACFRGTVADGN